MNITIKTIPHKDQRYETVGDWWFDGKGDLQIRVSGLSNWRREALIAVHELVEVLICKQDGVTQESVDSFDKEFESKRPEGNTDEPGDDPKSPYSKQHCVATGIERILAAGLDVCWKGYEEEINSL